IFCTTLPQKRENDQNPFSNPENWLRKRNAVIECCEKYRVPCLDLYSLLPWDFSREPYWVSPTSMVENRGIYTMDGLHPNKFGYRDIAHLVAEFLKTH
ncbi:MAG: SGNH/GDSL hydrolase family protein, partial [Clostridia bacterium]|nr:SGNH/GDSL hydrolase family protein [Clostridia bacterium]